MGGARVERRDTHRPRQKVMGFANGSTHLTGYRYCCVPFGEVPVPVVLF